MKTGKDKGSAIAICKTTFKKMKKDKAKSSFIINELITNLTKRINNLL